MVGLVNCAINENTYLKRNYDEHPLLHKITFLSESFIFCFNSLTMALVQVIQVFETGH